MVVRLKNLRSSERCHGIADPSPMTPLRPTATIIVTFSSTWLMPARLADAGGSHRDGGLDARLGDVVDELEVVEVEVVDRRLARSDPHPRQRVGRAGQLGAGLLEVVEVEVRVAER